MSLTPQQKVNTDKSGKHRTSAMKEPAVQHPGEVYYGAGGPPALDSGHGGGDAGGNNSGVFNPEKGPQSRVQYQQAAGKWMHQEPMQQAPPASWSQEAPPGPAWGQNFGGPYMGGVNNIRGQMPFHKGGGHDVGVGVLQMGGETQPLEVYREAPPPQAPVVRGAGLVEWDQHAAAAAMRQAQLQAYQQQQQQGHKSVVDLPGQPPPHAPSSHVAMPPGSMLQPFPLAFGGPAKPQQQQQQQLPPGYYPVFQSNKGAMPNLQGYNEQPKTQHQLLQHQMQPHQMHHQQQLQQQQHHHQLQQQQQHLQQQQQQHQMQQHKLQQQQQLQQQMQQQYHHQQQQLQERRQHMHQMQQLHSQNLQQQETAQLQLQQKQQQQNQNMPTAYQLPPEPCPTDASPQKENVQSVGGDAAQQRQARSQPDDPSATSDLACAEKASSNPPELSSSEAPATVGPRRSRRLSRDGQSPLGPPNITPWASQASKEPPSSSQNGLGGGGAEAQVTTGGVIQSTRRRRRTSKEVNLETLAQKASEMETLPSSTKASKEEPLVIPVSVPVHGSPPGGPCPQSEQRPPVQHDHKPSVIVARRRSLKNPPSENIGQDEDEDGRSKFKRRPRPEPLFIPPPKPSTFIAPSVYSNITHYQSHLRSPVRLPDHPRPLIPYTPPPILSPVREGSGLFFSTFLSNMAAGNNQSLPPPATPKSAVRSLLRSTSSDITPQDPPVLSSITDAAPVCFEPRINIGLQYQAEVPELRGRDATQSDLHKADVVWLPLEESHLKAGGEQQQQQQQQHMEDVMSLACSSVLRGGGTNQELVLHCMHASGGDILETLRLLMIGERVFPKDHHLADYHYSGSDCWTAAEKRYFNKGISAYRKDFIKVQKLVQTKTVAQCVEFYYTYKKQVKIGRSGTLTYGPPDSPEEKSTEAVVDIKSSQSKWTQAEVEGDDKKEDSGDQNQNVNLASVTHSLQVHDYAGPAPVLKEHSSSANPESAAPLSAPRKPRPEPAAKKAKAPPKPTQNPEGVFPCKKCSRVFYKVKSRSAHMKSHAEQEKKAAALRQKEREEEERAASVAAEAAAAAAARARKLKAAQAQAQAAIAGGTDGGGNGNGVAEAAEGSSQDESSSEEDENDEDWH